LDDKSIGGMIQTLASKQVKSILINASSLTLIYKYLEKNPTEAAIVKLESIVSTAEILPEDIRKPLGKILDCQVRSMYANQENGIMAIQDGDGKEYYFDTSTYVIEVLKLDSDEPAAKGEIGRLVITDLYNYAFPLIRYENGDMGIILEQVEGDKYRVYLEEISGRITDLIYDSYGRLLSPSAVNIRMWVSKGIKQFQFIQVDEKKYQLKINPESDKVDENAIFESIMPLLGEDAELEIIYVEEIPVLNSGKRKQTVNLYRKPS
jgi:phenylacetate-CoA ligase